MKSEREFLDDLWRDLSGLPRVPLPKAKPSLAELVATQWSPEFERLMRNRLIMGALRYETFEQKRRAGHRWDLVGAVGNKIAQYERTGNTEYLVDAANYCLLAFEFDVHPLKHFGATDDEDHCQEK